MAQSTITSFFAHRKRPTTEDSKARSKVIIMGSDAGYVDSRDDTSDALARSKSQTTVVFKNSNAELSSPNQSLKPKPKVAKRIVSRKPAKIKGLGVNQPNLISFLKEPGTEKFDEKCGIEAKSENSETTLAPPNVLFEMKGLLSPRKENSEDSSPVESNLMTTVPKSSNENKSSDDSESNKTVEKLTDSKKSKAQLVRKELSQADIKTKLNQHARRGDLMARLARIGQLSDKAKNISETKRKLFESDDSSKSSLNDKGSKPQLDKFDAVHLGALVSPSKSPMKSPFKSSLKGSSGLSSPSFKKPQLDKFDAIHLEVPVSPSKSPMKSPFKSPLKGSPGPSSPAFKRYSSLAALPSTQHLPLPYTYHHLAELFRCVDTVASMLFNRNELVTFAKLQPAVQEMSRKTLTLQHVAQIATVYPEAFLFKQEKFSKYASPTKQGKYTLVLTPVLPEKTADGDDVSSAMTSSVLLERKRIFYKRLIEIVKGHHDEFLASHYPEVNIPRDLITRWHPEFPVNEVPDIKPSDLPKPPNEGRCSSARDILEKAQHLYSCNSRMEKALETLAVNSDVNTGKEVQVQIVDAQPNPPLSSTSKKLPNLKGIPKALLEIVRAREAARTRIAMTRTPAQEKEAFQYSQLPKIAQILRNIFVTEKKETLPLETVIEKVINSYPSSLSTKEVEEHLQLLMKAVPGWLTFEHLLKTDYLKLSKKREIKDILKKLEKLIKG